MAAPGQAQKRPGLSPRRESESERLHVNDLLQRRHKIWVDLRLKPIGLQDSRHTAATWLDHAGVSPKIVSALMGHKAPKRQPGAAPITLRDQLQRFLNERVAEEADHSFALAA